MAKSFIIDIQDSPRTGLGIRVNTKKSPPSKGCKLVQILVLGGTRC